MVIIKKLFRAALKTQNLKEGGREDGESFRRTEW
jgi:hypothetical protein